MFFRPWNRLPISSPEETGYPTVQSITPNADVPAGGTSVTITGTHFRVANGAAPTVFFDETPATNVVLVNETTITCTVPAGAAGVVDVTVFIGTQAATLAEGFTYYTADMLTLTPNHGPASGGTQVIVFGRNFVTGSTFTFDGEAATATFLDDQHYLVVAPAHALGFVDVVMVEPGGATVTFPSAYKYTLLTRGEDIRRLPSVNVHEALGNSPNTCSFVVDGQSSAPIPGERIQIYDDLELLFAGTVVNVKTTYEGQTDQLAWMVSCVDFTWLLNRRRPTGVYNQVRADEIVKDLVTKFAPGFTVDHVQTNLAPITMSFDGGDDFSTCLTRIARAIGGGHWRIDYTQDVHFFHIVPPNFAMPDVPNTADPASTSVMPTGLSAAPTTALVAPAHAFSTTAGWVQMAYSFLYSNGFETALSELPAPLYTSGAFDFSVSGIPTGASLGTLTCVGVRIYIRFQTDWTTWIGIVEVPNGTASVNGLYAGEGVAFRPEIATSRNSTLRNVTQPSKPVGSPSGGNEGTTAPTFTTTNPVYGDAWLGGAFSYAVAAVYPDGTESVISDASPAVTRSSVTGNASTLRSIHLGTVPVGAAVNGKSPVYRVIYQARLGIWLPQNISIAGFIPNNTTTDLFFVPMYIPVPNGRFKGGSVPVEAPVWPNDDGPFLEDDVPPDPIDDDNEDLLHGDSGSQQFEIEQDNSQLCNRIFVKGKSTTLIEDAFAGDGVLHVASLVSPVLHPGGGQLWTPVGILTYNGFDDSDETDPVISLVQPLTQDMLAGTTINIFLMAENKAAQQALGKIEFDVNGDPTDGIHEAMISDDSIETWADLYMRAFATLEQFSLPIVTVRYATRDAKTKAGTTVEVDLSHPPCKGSFLIQEVDKDQIHDESDQIGARYTVTASSVRFNLEDYLLALGEAPAAGDTVPTLSGISGVDTSASSGRVTADLLNSLKGHFSYSAFNATNGSWALLLGSVSASFSGGVSAGVEFVDTRGNWARCTSSALAGNAAGYSQSGTFLHIEHNPIMQFYFRTGSNISNIRLWIQMGIAVTGNVDTPTNKAFGIRYSTPRGDTGFMPFTYDGTNPITVYGGFQTIEPNKEYRVRIEVTDGGQYFFCTITDQTGASISSPSLPLPTLLLNSNINPSVNLVTTESVSKTIDFLNIGFQSGLN